MGNHKAYAAHIGAAAVFAVIKRGLEDRGGEDDLIIERVVEGIDRLRRNVPLAFVRPASEKAQAVFDADVHAPHEIGHQAPALRDRRDLHHILFFRPLVRISDFDIHSFQLADGFLFCRPAHPVLLHDNGFIFVQDQGYDFFHVFFIFFRKMFFHIDHAEIPGQQLLRQAQPDRLIVPFLRYAVERVFHALIEPGHGRAAVFGRVVEQDKGRVGF